MKDKEWLLLQALIKKKGSTIAIDDLISWLQVSDRTIRNYVNHLNDLLKDQGATISSRYGQGLCLEVQDGIAFKTYLQSLEDTGQLYMVNPGLRQQYMVKQLAIGQTLTIDQLINELFVSEATILNDLAEIRKSIYPHHLNVKLTGHNKLTLEGKERDIRKYLKQTYFHDFTLGRDFTNPLASTLLASVDIEAIRRIVLAESNKEDFYLTDIIIDNLVLHLALSILRQGDNRTIGDNPLRPDDPQSDAATSRELQIGQRIVQALEAHFAMTLAQEERVFIADHLRAFSRTDQQSAKDQIASHLDPWLSDLSSRLQIPFEDDTVLKESLVQHLLFLQQRLADNIQILNPIRDEIMKTYPSLHDQVKAGLLQLEGIQAYPLNDDEVSYVTLHFAAAIERSNRPIKAVVICATGIGTSNLLEARIKSVFGNKIAIQAVMGLYELKHWDFSQTDLVISTVATNHLVLRVPTVTVSALLKAEDIDAIAYYLPSHLDPERKVKASNHHFGHDLAQLIERVDFKVMESADRDQVLTYMTSKVADLEDEEIQEALLKQVNYRESFGSVVFSDWLAVPHPIEKLTHQSHLVVVKINQGLEWDQIGQAIKLVVGLFPAKFDDLLMRDLSKRLIDLMGQDAIKDKIEALSTKEAFQSLLVNARTE